jgi:hypothetical protein
VPHDRLERRSLALHQAIADKLRQHPELLSIALDNIERWSQRHGRAQPYLDTWRQILGLPFPELLDLIEEDSPRMTQLRQSTPFAGVLDPSERWRIYDTFGTGARNPRGGDHR